MHQDEPRGERSDSWRLRSLRAGGRALNSSHLGPTHLGGEAIVAFVDGELSVGAHHRAAAHLAVCTQCVADVQAQLQARAAVRTAGTPCPPAGLLGALRQIPDALRQLPDAHPAAPPASLGEPARGAVVLGSDGAWISVLRPERYRSAEHTTTAATHRRHGYPLVVLAVALLTVGAGVGASRAPAAAGLLPGAGSPPAAQAGMNRTNTQG